MQTLHKQKDEHSITEIQGENSVTEKSVDIFFHTVSLNVLNRDS